MRHGNDTENIIHFETTCGGFRQTCIAVQELEDYQRSVPDLLSSTEAVGLFKTIYLTAGLNIDWWTNLKGQVVPCNGIWALDGRRMSVLVVAEARS